MQLVPEAFTTTSVTGAVARPEEAEMRDLPMTITFTRTGPPQTQTRLEEVLGTRLPDAYLEFMLTQNGGVLDASAHLPRDDSGASVRAFLIIDDPDGRDGYDFSDYLRTSADRYPDGFLPIAVDASSNLILLYTGHEQPGSVWFWDHEAEADEGEPPRDDNITRIAASFPAFLGALTTEFSADEQAKIDRMVQTGTFTPGSSRSDEPCTFGGKR